ncbi:bacillithiol system redox-active protein YtxJ [Gillisia sp. CAL575]|uniref:bacillithiol system redox-active protein YtxJ n=1 Tax=Gillisia sp. CAL575 TaxID=985255 RepID=UPI0003A70829|nr:bacillithiol system redox-active protein YtxJ [Gillisia sp. CAL575]
MGFFDKMFKSDNDNEKPEKNSVPWIQLITIETLEVIAEDSFNQPIAILKHSTSCGISRMVLRQFEQNYNLDPDSVKLYFLDLLSYRDISNKIASRFNVPHESPQLIVIKDGKVIYTASHSEINVEKLKTL